MRQVVGRATRELGTEDLAALRVRHTHCVLDVGTGDGKHVLAVARARPDTLVIGLDAAPDAMRPTSARAAAKPARGGTPNAIFVWAPAERLPDGLAGVTEVHALMPWGSLLRALAAPDVAVLRELAGVCKRDAAFLVTLNLHAWRPPVPEVGSTPEPTPESVPDTLGPGYTEAGWTITDATHSDAAEITALGTSWTKRLGASRESLAVLALRGTIA